MGLLQAIVKLEGQAGFVIVEASQRLTALPGLYGVVQLLHIRKISAADQEHRFPIVGEVAQINGQEQVGEGHHGQIALAIGINRLNGEVCQLHAHAAAGAVEGSLAALKQLRLSVLIDARS